jgi:hypothetical protein
MNNKVIKKLRKQYRKSVNRIATKDVKSEVFRVARNRDILGIILIVENVILIVLFLLFILPLIR